MSPIDDHAVSGKLIDDRAVQRRLWIVDLQVERRLVIDHDEENIRPVCAEKKTERKKRKQRQGERFHVQRLSLADSIGFWKFAIHFFNPVTESVARKRSEIEASVPAAIEARVDDGLYG